MNFNLTKIWNIKCKGTAKTWVSENVKTVRHNLPIIINSHNAESMMLQLVRIYQYQHS